MCDKMIFGKEKKKYAVKMSYRLFTGRTKKN